MYNKIKNKLLQISRDTSNFLTNLNIQRASIVLPGGNIHARRLSLDKTKIKAKSRISISSNCWDSKEESLRQSYQRTPSPPPPPYPPPPPPSSHPQSCHWRLPAVPSLWPRPRSCPGLVRSWGSPWTQSSLCQWDRSRGLALKFESFIF